MSGGEPILAVRHLGVRYGGITAVRDVSFEIQPGEIVTLIGSNGAGKSSILRALSGLVPCTGEIRFMGRDLRGMPADRIVGAGVAHVPEGRGIFGNLTVQENLALATWQRRDAAEIRADRERVLALFPILRDRCKQEAGTLSGGEQQMLAVGRALMARARLMLLDEPSMGLSPVLVRDIFRILREINQAGTTLLLVEQNAHMALRLASRAYVLETGSIAFAGSSAELSGNPKIREAYLGT